MDAKDIAALFRSAVEAENKDFFEDTNTFAEQDFFTQLGWFTNQIEARLTKNTPSPNILALVATLGGAIGKSEPTSYINEAYKIWKAADKRIREEALCSREEIEENLSQVGVEFRIGAWPKNNDGRDTLNLDFNPFMCLCFPDQKETMRKSSYKSYLKDTHSGENEPNQKEIEGRLKKKTGSKFVPKDLNIEGHNIVAWWMKQEAFDPLSFPKGSLGDLIQIGLDMIPENAQDNETGNT
ncbi:hypothetical protein N9170_03095 [Akkermansiaceae bacterium]|nr:hypothetical protein [Akkermansiaceae bacterium]